MNWDVVKKEIETIEWVTEYLDLHEQQEIAILIVNNMEKCGGLVKAIDMILQIAREVECEEEDEESQSDVD